MACHEYARYTCYRFEIPTAFRHGGIFIKMGEITMFEKRKYAKHYGRCLKLARKNTRLHRVDLADYFNTSLFNIEKYERGITPIPADILIQLFTTALYQQVLDEI